MISRKSITSALTAATFASAVMFTTPAVARPGNGAQSLWDPFSNGGCFVTDVAGVTTLDSSCQAHLTIKGGFASPDLAMYQDNGHLPEGATLPTSAVTNDISYDVPGIGHITCSETITPSGEYKSKCYFNVHTQ